MNKRQVTFIAMIAVIVIGVSGWLYAEKLTTTTLTVETAEIPGLPPDPGEAGKKTLEGIDSDHDGVRDDVERWIAMSSMSQIKRQAGLKQLALAEQKFIEDRMNRSSTIAHMKEVIDAWNCLRYVIGSDEETDLLVDEFDLIFFNTPARVLANDEADDQLGGTLLPRLVTDGSPELCSA